MPKKVHGMIRVRNIKLSISKAPTLKEQFRVINAKKGPSFVCTAFRDFLLHTKKKSFSILLFLYRKGAAVMERVAKGYALISKFLNCFFTGKKRSCLLGEKADSLLSELGKIV